jgi:hypothetical protein
MAREYFTSQSKHTVHDRVYDILPLTQLNCVHDLFAYDTLILQSTFMPLKIRYLFQLRFTKRNFVNNFSITMFQFVRVCLIFAQSVRKMLDKLQG